MLSAQGSAMNWTLDNDSKTEANVDIENAITDRDENLAKIEIATLAIIFLVTVLGNGTVLLALWTRRRYAGRKKLSRMYFFILHLSIADLITAFLSVLPQLGWEVTYRFNGGFVLCKLVKYGQTLGPYLSSYVLMATAIDRHQAICYPLTYCSWTSRRSKVMVWLAWATSLAFCVPQVHDYEPSEGTANEGHMYERKLAALLALRLCNLKKKFNLLINAKNFDKWDDIVIITEDNGIKKLYCLQLKHVTGASNAILRNDMFEPAPNKSKTICDINKLFEGYQKIKKFISSDDQNSALFQNIDVANIKIILFTNIKGKLLIQECQDDDCLPLFQTQVKEEQENVSIDVRSLKRKLSTDDEWQNFFEHFLFFGDQVGQKQLTVLIKEEISKFLNLNVIPQNIAKDYQEYVDLWSDGKLEGHHTLTENHIRNILNEILVLGLNIIIPPANTFEVDERSGHEEWNQIITEKSLIVLQNVDDEILSFIFENIAAYQNIFKTSLIQKILKFEEVDTKKVIDTLKSKKFDLRNYVGKYNDRIHNSTKILAALLWKLGIIPLVIKIQTLSDAEIVQKILDIATGRNTKLIVILQGIQYKFALQTTFEYLKNIESQHLHVLYDKRIQIHGHEFTIRQLLTQCPTLKNKLTTENIARILTRNSTIGENFECKLYCIERKIATIRLSNEALKIKSDIFVICGEKATVNNLEFIPNLSISGCIQHEIDNQLTKEVLERCRVLLIANNDVRICTEVYKTVCSLTTKTVHFIKLHLYQDTVSLQWLRTNGTIESIKSYRIYCETLPKQDIQSITGNINILSADTGYGKTMVMYQLAQKQEGHLVIFIPLAHHAERFLDEEQNEIQRLKYFFTYKSTENELQLNIFDSFLEEGKVLVILDGMDEISRIHKEKVFNFIKGITPLNIQIWITCRVSVQLELENRVNALAYRLNPFTESEQEEFLRKYEFAQNNMENILKNKQELYEIPLYLYMACESSLSSDNVLGLCENFIQQEVAKYCAMKRLGEENINYFSGKLQEFINNFALYTLLPSEIVKEAVKEVSLKTDMKFYIDEGYTSFGLIRKSSYQNQYVFIHKTISDYIAAKAIIQMEEGKCKTTIIQYLFDEKFTSLRYIFHKLKIETANKSEQKTMVVDEDCGQIKTRSELKAAILDKVYDQVKNYLGKNQSETVKEDYTTSLHLAAQWGVRHYYSNVNNGTSIDERYCYRANEQGTEEIVQLLLQNRKIKQLIYQQDQLLGWTPIQYADHSESLGILEKFAGIDTFGLDNSQMLTKIPKSILLYFCIRYHYNNIFDLLCESEEIEWFIKFTDSENTFLHCACTYGNTYVLQVLFEKLSVNDVNKRGETPLHVAAYGHKNVVSHLISLPKIMEIMEIMEIMDNEGYNPLHRAVKCGQLEIVELLINNGANLETSTFDGHSLLHTAAYNNQLALLKLLIRKGASADKADNAGNVPLHTAIEWKSVDCVKTLIEAPTDIHNKNTIIDIQNKAGRTPLDLAVKLEHMDLVKLLTSYGAKVLTLDFTMEVPLWIKNYLKPLMKNPEGYISRSGTVDSGRDFEIKMAALLSLRCCGSETNDMHMSTNVEECGLFGDIFLCSRQKNGHSTSYLIQLKHQDNPKDISVSEFESNSGNYSLKKYTDELNKLSALNNSESRKTNVTNCLKSSDYIVFTLSTNRNLSEDTFSFLKTAIERPCLLNIINTEGHVYKLNWPQKDNQNVYLLTNQIHNYNINSYLRDTFAKLVHPLNLSVPNSEKAVKDYVAFVGKWAQGELGGRHFLTKTCVINVLADILFSPYMIFRKSNKINFVYNTKYSQTILNAMAGTNSLTIIAADGNNNSSNICQEIFHRLKLQYHDLPKLESWTESFKNEVQEKFYKNNHDIKNELVRTVGYVGKITLLDVYKCMWAMGKLPLVLEVTTLHDFENITTIHKLCHERIKIVLLNYTNLQLNL